MTTKVCKKCLTEYTGDLTENFYVRSSGRLKNTCKVCVRARSQERYENKKADILLQMSEYYQKNRLEKLEREKEYKSKIIYTMNLIGYGALPVTRQRCANWQCKGYLGYSLGTPGDLTSAAKEWESMWNNQRGRCLLTNEMMVPEGTSSLSAVVDHCHTTGEVRGLLSSVANKALGHIEALNIPLERLELYLAGGYSHRT